MSPDAAAWFGFMFFALFVGGGVLVLRGPVGRALARKIEGHAAGSGDLAEIEERLADVDSLRQRVGELEERVDFAERLLAQARTDMPQVKGPS
jgi:hypothetical protein